jgi:molybdate transport system ATP-binding protein
MKHIDARIVRRLPAVRDSPAFELNIHFEAPAGISAILGPSGAGKTLLLNCLGGFVRPDEGRILVDDRLYFDAAANIHLAPERRRCGYIFQDHALFPHMTVRQNLRFAASSAGANRLLLHRRTNELLDTFDLALLADRKPAQLSGGQKQRAALARLLITEPRLLLLDEPSRGLDLRLRLAFWDLLRSLRERVDIPVLLVSHDIEECCELGDSIAVLEDGRLLQYAAREEVLKKPATVEVARLLGIYNIGPAEILALNPAQNRSRLRLFEQEIEGPYFPGHLIGDSGFVCLRRSEMTVLRDPREAAGNRLTLRIEDVSRSPLGVRVSLEHGFSVILSEAEHAEYAGSERLTLSAPASAVAFTGA